MPDAAFLYYLPLSDQIMQASDAHWSPLGVAVQNGRSRIILPPPRYTSKSVVACLVA